MRFLFLSLSILLTAALVQVFLPWYSLPLVALGLGWLFRLDAGKSFLAGFLAGFFLWGAYAWFLNDLNDGILAARIGQLFGGLSAAVMVLVTAAFAGMFGGLGALTGAVGRAGG